jgi:hypothetical protein
MENMAVVGELRQKWSAMTVGETGGVEDDFSEEVCETGLSRRRFVGTGAALAAATAASAFSPWLSGAGAAQTRSDARRARPAGDYQYLKGRPPRARVGKSWRR